MPGPVGELLLADPDQLVDGPAGEAEPRLGLLGALMLPAVGRFRLLLLGERLRLLAADEGRADQRRSRQEDQRHHARPDDRRVPPRPGPRAAPPSGRPAGQDRPAVEEPLQVVGQFLRRRVAVGRLLADRLQDDRLQLGAGSTAPAIEATRARRRRSAGSARCGRCPSNGGRSVSSS